MTVMNRRAKSAIRSLVLTLRHKLEDDIAIQLKRYGFAGERWLPLERLPHIERDDQAASDHYRLKAALEQQLRRMGVDPGKAKPQQRAEAADWFVREIAFTHLNRLVALKCLAGRRPPANYILWPSYPVLKECIALINSLDTTADLTPTSPNTPDASNLQRLD